MSIFDNRQDKQKRLAEATKGKTNAEKRSIEETLLKPEELPIYTGELPEHRNDLDARTVLIVFRDEAQMQLVGELLSIRKSKTSGGLYITDISMLEKIARRVKNGSLVLRDGKIMFPKRISGKK